MRLPRSILCSSNPTPWLDAGAAQCRSGISPRTVIEEMA